MKNPGYGPVYMYALTFTVTKQKIKFKSKILILFKDNFWIRISNPALFYFMKQSVAFHEIIIVEMCFKLVDKVHLISLYTVCM